MMIRGIARAQHDRALLENPLDPYLDEDQKFYSCEEYLHIKQRPQETVQDFFDRFESTKIQAEELELPPSDVLAR
jgi:hypothetical protein